MHQYANIEKAVLTCALGLQKNYVEVVDHTTDVIDEVQSGCAAGKWHAINSSGYVSHTIAGVSNGVFLAFKITWS